jgi:hypothetical protein
MKHRLLVVLAVVAMAACGPFCGGGKLTFFNGHALASTTCPANSNNYQYTTPASVEVDNETGQRVLVTQIQVKWTLVSKQGQWDDPVGTTGALDVANFSPKSIDSGSNTTMKIDMPWFCTNQGITTDTYGEFSDVLVLTTSSGAYSVSVNNTRMVMG